MRNGIAAFFLLLASLAHAQNSQFLFDGTGNLQAQAMETLALPQILGQPQMQVVIPGHTASFSVVVADTRGVSYQWLFNNSAISGATSDALLLANVSTTNEGAYAVIVDNGSGSVTSAPAALMIDSRGCGMPDSWQLKYFGNLNQNPTGDFDGDGVSNLQEFLNGTNPTNAASVLYRITLLNDGGAVVAVPNQTTYTNGQVVTLTAIGSDGFPFHAWTGDVVSRSDPITVTMTNNLNLFAHFQPFLLHWTNSVSGDWNVASNWFPNLVPSSNESVEIGASGAVLNGVVVTENSNVDLVNFALGRSTTGFELSGAGRVTIAGVGVWRAGTMSGSGATVILPGASLSISNTSTIALNNRTLEDAGTVSWTGGNMTMNAGIITNDAGAQFELLDPASFTFAGGTPRFDNAGTFLLPPAGTTAFNGVALNNYHTTLNLTGAGALLSMNAGGVDTGTMTVPAGATINFGGGVFNCSANSAITGAGILLVSGGTANLAGTVNVSGTNSFTGGTANLTGNYTCVSNTLLDISGGTANFDGTGIIAPNNVKLNGTLGGASTVTVGSSMNWTGGSMTGSGQTIIGPQATLNIPAFTGYGGVYLYNRTLENSGTVVWGGGNLGLTGVITNDAGASFHILNAAVFNYAGNTPRFDNAGTFLPSSTGTTAFNGILFDNYGAINLTGGSVLYLNGGGTNSGPITVPAGATINFGGGVFNAGAGSSITGAGSLQVSGGTKNLAGTVNVSGTNSFSNGTANLTGNYTCVGNTLLDISGGTVNFNGSGTVSPNQVNLNGALGGANTVTVGSVMNWTGGSMNGSGHTIIRPGATLNIAAFTGYGGVYLYDRTLENAGTVVWGGGNLGLTGVITNDAGASFHILNAAVFNYAGNTPRFDNAGTFLPSSTGTTAFNGILFDNYGAINLTGGSVLYLNGGGTNSGPITVPAGATINFGGGVFNAGAGSSITGAGSLQVSGGTKNLAGTVNVSGTNSFSNGTANLTGNYTCVGNTLLDISGGTVNFNGSGTVSPNQVNLNGALGGANTVTVGSVMNWTGGSMNGSGHTIIRPGATLNIAAFTGYGGVYLYDRTLENAGTVVWGGGNLGLTGVITNDAGASFQIQGAAAFNYGGGSPRFDNAGTFRKSVSTGTTTIGNSVSFTNYGTVDIQSGVLAANGGYGSSSNAVLNCALSGTLRGTNYGQIQVSGSVTLNGTLSVNLANNYLPTTNDSFTVLSAGTCNGAFANFIYPSNKVSMLLSDTTTSVIVRVSAGTRRSPTDASAAGAGRLERGAYLDSHLEHHLPPGV